MTYKTLELEGDNHFANGDYGDAHDSYKCAIRLNDDASVRERLMLKRMRAFEKAYPSRWKKFLRDLGVAA